MTLSVSRIVTSGIFSLDGQDFEVDNNVWILGDDSEVVVIDAAHQAAAITQAVGGRTVKAVVCTHGHNDHINAAGEVADATGAPILLHPADRMLWDVVHPTRTPQPLAGGQELTVAGTALTVRHTPGHSPGAVCLYAPALGAVLTGDTLFKGGPGATGRSYSSFPAIIESIRAQLLGLPAATRVLTGHGGDTTIGGEVGSLQEWIARGH